jgi:hypothetical protein
MINLTIVEIPIDEINADDPTCILNAFPFMVEDENGARWFGAQTFEECEEYITKHLTQE